MPIYKLNGETYDIPADVVSDFEKDNPNATVTYFAGGDEYDIPVSERDGFLKDFPDATTDRQQPAAKGNSRQQGFDPSEFSGFIGSVRQTVGQSQQASNRIGNRSQRIGLDIPDTDYGRVNLGQNRKVTTGQQRVNLDTGKLENTYITEAGNEYGTRAEADIEQNAIDEINRRKANPLGTDMEDSYQEGRRLDARIAELEAKRNAATRENNGFVYTDKTAFTDEEDEELQNLKAAKRQIDQRIVTLEREKEDYETSGVFDSIGKAGGDFFRGMYDMARDPSVFSFGITDLADMTQLYKVKRKMDEAKEAGVDPELTDTEQSLLQNTMLNSYAQQQYGKNRSDFYGYGQIAMQAIPFVGEFFLTGGFKTISDIGAKYGAKKAADWALKGWKAAVVKNTGVLAGDLASGWAMANTTGAAKTAADILDRHIGDVYVGEDGNYYFDDGKSLAQAVYEGELVNTFEYYTEKLGDHLNIGGFLARGAEKYGLSKLSKAVSFLSGSKTMKALGVHDYPSEVFEEEANLLLNATFGLDNNFETDPNSKDFQNSVFNGKTQKDIVFGMFFSLGVLNAPRYVQTGYTAAQYKRYQHKVSTADANAASVFGADNWQMIKEQIDNCDNEGMAELMQSVADGGMKAEQKAATSRYAADLMTMRGYNSALMSMISGDEEDVTPQAQAAGAVDQSYIEGYDTQDPDLLKQYVDEANAALQDLSQYGDEFTKMVVLSRDPVSTMSDIMDKRDIYTDDQIAAAADYFQKQAKVNGIMDGALGRIDLQVEQAIGEVRANTHQATGNVYSAKGADDVDYNIISGDVETDPDTGLPVLVGTGGAVVVRDAFGNVSVKSPQELSIYSVQSADVMINDLNTDFREQLTKQADDDITFGSPANEVYQLEDTVTLNDGEGNVIEGQIGMMPNSIDGVYVVYTADNKALQFTADDLNRRIVAHNGMEVQRTSSQATEIQQPTEQAQGGDEGQTGGATIQPQAQPAQSGEQTGGKNTIGDQGGESNQPVSALSRIPVLQDEKGRPLMNKKGKPQYLWHKASVEDAAAALIETTGGDMVMARDTASDLVKNAQAGLEKIRRQKPKGEDPIEIAESRMEIRRQEQEQQAVIKQWQDVNQAIQKQMRDEAAARQAEEEAAKTAEQKAREAEEARQREEKQREQDRQRIREQIEKEKERRNKEYQPLVKAREEMAGDADALAILGDTEPRSLEEWVSSLLRPHSILWQNASDTEIGLQSELGLKRGDMQRMMSLLGTKESGAKPFGNVVLDIYEALPEGMKNQYTDNDVRNTLLNLFNEGSSSRMMHLTEENRIAEANTIMQENLRREAEAEMEAWAEAYHLTPEERETYEDFLEMQTMNGAETEYINQIIEENESNTTGEALDMQPTSGTAGRESEGGEKQVQGQGAAETAAADQEQPQPEQGAEADTGEQVVSDDNVPGGTPEPGAIAPSEQLKPTDLRDAVRVESPEIGVAEANAKAREASDNQLIPEDQRRILTNEEIDNILDALEDVAVPQKQIPYDKAEWDKLFKNPIQTPAGLVRMGPHQFVKLSPNPYQKQDRRGWIAQIYETLVSPDLIVEQYDPEEGAERDYKLVFIKSFINSSGESVTYFTSVTVKKGGMEVVLTNHFKKYKDIRNLLKKGKLCFSSISPSGMQTEANQPLPSATTSETDMNAGVSEDKDTNNPANLQEKTGKSSDLGATSSPEQIAEEENRVDTNPSDAQKEAGNYQKGHIKIDGLDISIENPKGSIRKGTDANGKQWESTMHNTYGYIRGTEGADKDHIDVFLSDDPTRPDKVFIVQQRKKVNGAWKFDELKVLLGFENASQASNAYLSNYEEGWNGMDALIETDMESFKDWLKNGNQNGTYKEDGAWAKIYPGVSTMVADEGEMPEPEQQEVRVLRGERDNNLSGMDRELPEVPGGYGATAISQGDPGQNRRERELLQGELQVDGLDNPISEQKDGTLSDVQGQNNVNAAVGRGNGASAEENKIQNPDVPLGRRQDTGNSRRDQGQLQNDNISGQNNENGGLGEGTQSELQDVKEQTETGLVNGTNNNGTDEHKADGEALSPDSQEKALRDAVVDHLRSIGVEVSTDWQEGQRILDEYNGNGQVKKMAVDTTTPEYQQMVKQAEERIDKRLEEYRENKKKQNSRPASRIPNTGPTSPQQSGGKGIAPSGAKISKKLHSSKDLAEKMADFIENLPNNNTLTPENFALQIVRALQVPEQQGRNSQYASVVSDDGGTYTIRISDHKGNARNIIIKGVRTDKGYSIVLETPNSPTSEFKKTTWAKVHEYVYDNPTKERMADIAKSIFGLFDSGEYVDVGKAKSYDISPKINQHKVYHGSGAEFDAFDHSHMGEGAGSQAFGYGTYVTNSKRIGTDYANITSRGWLYRGMDGKELRASNDDLPEGRYYTDNEIRSFVLDYMNAGSSFEQAVDKVRRSTQSAINDHEEHLSELSPAEKKDLEGFRQELKLIDSFRPEDFKRDDRYLYDVEIPDDTGSNYIDWENPIDQPTVKRVKDAALSLVTESQKKYLEQVEYPEVDPQIEEDLSIFGPSPKYEPDPERLAMEIIDKYLGQLDGKSIRGKDLYNSLSYLFLSDRDTSKFLYDLGYVGIKYPAGTIMGGGDGSTNYVIFNEDDAKITDRTKFFKTPDGHAYGYTYKGKLYIDPRIATAETPVHEYGHLWCEMKRQTAPEEWNHIKQVMLGDELVQPIIEKVRRDYPELTREGKEDDFIEEIITQFSGKRGSERLKEIADEVAAERGGIFGKAEAVTAMQRLKNILNSFWEGVAKMMGWKYRNANQIADRIMADMLNGVDPRQRMKEANGQIRSQQEIERTLMGVHNISEDKLKKVLKQGGLANPSLAVIDTKNHIHTDYGEISLIPRSSMIDARTGRNAGTWTADAWTPTYPQVTKRMSSKGQDKYWAETRKFLGDEPGDIRSKTMMAFESWMENGVSPERLSYWYLKERGRKPEQVMYEPSMAKEDIEAYHQAMGEHDRFSELDEAGKKAVLALIAKDRGETPDEMAAKMQELKERNTQRMNDESVKAFVKMRAERVIGEIDEYGVPYSYISDFDYKVRNAERTDGKLNVDSTLSKAAEQVKSEGLEEDFNKWLEEKEKSYGVEEWLYNGTDSEGRQKWVRNTLENASRLMRNQGRNGAHGMATGNLIATVAKRVTTLDQIRKERGNLDTTLEEHEAFKEKWGDALLELCNKCGDELWVGEARLQEALGTKDPVGYLKKEYGVELSKEDAELLSTFIKEVRDNFPTGYFETKFERPVMLDEFAVAVVPETTSPEVVNALKEAGLDVRTYDNTGSLEQQHENRRQATMDAVKGRDDIMFQKKREAERVKTFHDAIDEMFSNPDFDKTAHSRDRYDLGDTPEFMKKVGITGDSFSLSFKNIKTHMGKDADHNLTAKEWHELPEAIKKPFLITTYGDKEGRYRLYTSIKVGNKFAVVGIDVIKTNQGKDKPMLEVNRIKTVFGRDRYVMENGEQILAYDEKMTPEQEALLRGHNFREYPSVQELSSGSKDTKNSDTIQENQGENASEAPKFQRTGSPEPESERPRYQKGEDALHYAERLAEYERQKKMEEEDVAIPSFDDADIAMSTYNQTVAKKALKWQEAWQDGMISVKAIQDAIEKETGNKATGAEDAYRYENRMHGRSKNMGEQFEWSFYKPMLEAFSQFMKKTGMDIGQTMDYMIAKHGLERNMYYAFRDAMKSKVAEEIKEEREKLEKEYAKGRMSELDYNKELARLKEKESTGVDDAIGELRDTDEYKLLQQDYADGKISYPEYIRGNEELRRNASMRKTPKKDSDGNVVSTNYYDDFAQDFSGLTGTLAKDMYDEAQKVKRAAQRTVDPETRKSLWQAYDRRMREAYEAARREAETIVLAAERNDEKKPVGDTPAGRLWNAVNAATKRTLQISYDSGMMDRKTYNKVRSMFDYYIPLRGWDENKASDAYTYVGKENVFSPAVKKTWGRTSQAENPLAYIGNIAISTIIAGHRNMLKQHFLNYVMNNPTSLVSISESWYENIAPEGEAPVWVLRSADTAGKSTDEIAQIVNDFNEEMLSKQAEGKAIPVTGRLRLDVNATKGQKAEHVIEVQRAGHTYQLYINGDPKAAQALNGTLPKSVSRISDTYIGRQLTKLNRSMAAFFTSKNPAFVVSNLSRDLNMAGASVAIKEGGEYNARFIANVAKVLAPRIGEGSGWNPAKKQPTGLMPSLLRRYKKGTLDPSDETERLFKEFMEEGGETGFVNMLSVDSFKEQMLGEIARMNGSSLLGSKGAKETSIGKGFRLLGDTFEFYNRCAEDATRFIVYMTSRQMGKSLEDSIADAKDVTLNFNRKGTGDKGNAEIRDLFIFVNPAIQALSNMCQMAKGHPLKFGAVAAAFIAGGALMPIINQWLLNMFGDDDDKEAYWNLPPWVRKNNLVMWIPGTKNFLTIPLAQEFRVFYGMGEMISCSVMDHSVGNMGMELVSSVADLVPINPTGNGGNLLVDLSPTGIQPMVQIGENIDFTGKPIWRENQGNKFAPMYTKAYVSTPGWMVKLSEAANDVTGGNEGRKGAVEEYAPFWGSYLNNPAVWNHLLQGYFGGMYNTIAKGFDVITTAAGGEMPKIYQTPVINRFLNRPVERDNAGVLGEEYYKLVNGRDQLDYELRVWKKKAADGDADAQKQVDEIMQSDDYRRSQVITHYEKIMKDLKAGEKAATEDYDKEDIKDMISMYKTQMMDELTDIDGGLDPLEAAKAKFNAAKTKAERILLQRRIERLMTIHSKDAKSSRDAVDKALSYRADELKDNQEGRKESAAYLKLATADNIVDDARIKAARAMIKPYLDKFKELEKVDGAEAFRYRSENMKWFKADDIIKKQTGAMKTNKGLLGNGRDADIMKLIDANRNRMLEAIKELDKQD